MQKFSRQGVEGEGDAPLPIADPQFQWLADSGRSEGPFFPPQGRSEAGIIDPLELEAPTDGE